MPASAVATKCYVRSTSTPAQNLGITQDELEALAIAAVESGSAELASLFDRLSSGDDAIAVRRGSR